MYSNEEKCVNIQKWIFLPVSSRGSHIPINNLQLALLKLKQIERKYQNQVNLLTSLSIYLYLVKTIHGYREKKHGNCLYIKTKTQKNLRWTQAWCCPKLMNDRVHFPHILTVEIEKSYRSIHLRSNRFLNAFKDFAIIGAIPVRTKTTTPKKTFKTLSKIKYKSELHKLNLHFWFSIWPLTKQWLEEKGNQNRLIWTDQLDEFGKLQQI